MITFADIEPFVPLVVIPVVGLGVRHKLVREGRWTPLKRVTLGIGLLAFLATEMARSFYRPWVYANDIDDWVVADTIGNSLGTVTAIFMVLALAGDGTRRDARIVAIVTAGLVGYELLNLTGHHPFDVNDVLATLVFAALSTVAYARIVARVPGPNPAS